MSKLPQGPRDLVSAIHEIQGRIRNLEVRSPYFGTGLEPTGDGGITLQGVALDPTVPGVARATATNIAVPTGMTEAAYVDLTVPSGCTRLLCTASARLYAVNANTTGGSDTFGADAIYCTLQLATQASVATPELIAGSNGVATTWAHESFVLDLLTTGATVRLSAHVQSAYQNVPAHLDTRCDLSGSLLWLR